MVAGWLAGCQAGRAACQQGPLTSVICCVTVVTAFSACAASCGVLPASTDIWVCTLMLLSSLRRAPGVTEMILTTICGRRGRVQARHRGQRAGTGLLWPAPRRAALCSAVSQPCRAPAQPGTPPPAPSAPRPHLLCRTDGRKGGNGPQSASCGWRSGQADTAASAHTTRVHAAFPRGRRWSARWQRSFAKPSLCKPAPKAVHAPSGTPVVSEAAARRSAM